MIRAIARRLLLIIALSASILTFGAFSRVSAYELYELHNLITNGDISIDTNTDGLADNFSVAYSYQTNSIQDYGQKALSTGVNTAIGYFQSGLDLTDGHIYYVSVKYTTNDISTFQQRIYVRTEKTSEYQDIYINYTKINQYSSYFTANRNHTRIYFNLRHNTTVIPNSTYMAIDNIMLFDITAQFGAGNEPSLSDFELLYLPDMDYFETYESFSAETYNNVNLSSYADMGNDLTGINYSKSIIDTYGENIDIDIYAYFYDTTYYPGHTTATYYRLYNNPTIQYLGNTEVLSWTESEYSDRVLLLETTDEQNELLRRALFDRFVGTDFDTDFTDDDGFLMIDVEAMSGDTVKFYFVLSSTFDLRVDISSFLISWDTDTHENEFSVVQEMYIKCQDKYDRTLLPALSASMGDYGTVLINDFGSQYTDVQSFNVEFEFTSPDSIDPSLVQTLYLYELGAFSSNDVVIGFINPDLPLPFEPGVCDWYEFGCQAKNGVNEFVAWFYEKLDIAEIVGYFQNIIDGGAVVLSLMPDSLVAAFTVIGAGIVLAITYGILHKIHGGGGD